MVLLERVAVVNGTAVSGVMMLVRIMKSKKILICICVRRVRGQLKTIQTDVNSEKRSSREPASSNKTILARLTQTIIATTATKTIIATTATPQMVNVISKDGNSEG